MLCFQCLRCSFQSIGVFCGVGALVYSAFSSVAVYCAFPVITSSIAVITVEMVITILATDFYCNFCKTHSATNINVTSFSWFQNRMSGGVLPSPTTGLFDGAPASVGRCYQKRHVLDFPTLWCSVSNTKV